jgi:hypothetical protein
MKFSARQGDILLVEVDKIPNNVKNKDNILALGEATNHSHRILNAQVMVDNLGNQFINVPQQAQVVHEEHKPITVPRGKYRLIQQREFDLVNEVTQQVTD